jgi:hemerythrin-like domain-containing protein
MDESLPTRRHLLGRAGSLGLILGTSGCSPGDGSDEARAKAEDVSPGEDLMREHGVLNRVLLIYEECGRRLRAGQDFDIRVLADAAGIIRRFIEEYHEQLEEKELFPRFESAGRLLDLVATLRLQHCAGRWLTSEILAGCKGDGPGTPKDRSAMADRLDRFVRMYRPHEAREDTVLFPALRRIVSSRDLDDLGEKFEEREEKLFGRNGFERIVQQTGQLEGSLGLFDLAQYTPRAQ